MFCQSSSVLYSVSEWTSNSSSSSAWLAIWAWSAAASGGAGLEREPHILNERSLINYASLPYRTDPGGIPSRHEPCTTTVHSHISSYVDCWVYYLSYPIYSYLLKTFCHPLIMIIPISWLPCARQAGQRALGREFARHRNKGGVFGC